MAKTDEDRQLATNARSSKMWRTLRIASKSKLNLFDRIDDGNNLQALFQPEGEENRNQKGNSPPEPAGKDDVPMEAAPAAPAAPTAAAEKEPDGPP